MEKFVYSFHEGSKDMRDVLGGKGANLAEMTNIGLPVPNGFTVSTAACNLYYQNDEKISESLEQEIYTKMTELEEATGKKFGSSENPLLVSVRSGAVVSMPGMMDTILNLGLNDEAVEGLAKLTGNPRFAYDSYRRFIQMFGNVVMGIRMSRFEDIFEAKKHKYDCKYDVDLSAENLKEIIDEYKALYERRMKAEFPQDAKFQLIEAVKAVFRSWNTERAVLYRKLNGISSALGTAVNVQMMVFGNMGENSGTGVAFSRNPATGENKLYGEFLVNAQGEDVVSGVRTPKPIRQMKDEFPDAYAQFAEIADKLEKHYLDMQDMEFTVENQKLYMLQTRIGKRTATAAVKIAVDMEEEGLIDKKTAVMRLDAKQVDQLLHPMFDPEALAEAEEIAEGLPASPGAATGHVYFTAQAAEQAAAKGSRAILVRQETSPEDLAGMVAAQGILTARGGMTSHAAVVARGMGKCCISGCDKLKVIEKDRVFYIDGDVYKEGDYISLDGTTGKVYAGKISTMPPELSGDFGKIMSWADEFRTMKVMTNADNPRDAKQAVEFGAEGIGLCRTEHMFFDEKRIPHIRHMILAEDEEEREKALDALLPFQKEDFKGIYEVMGERPVTIRLLDPPLHEFLPHTSTEIRTLADQFHISYDRLNRKVQSLKEFNPMLGHRGCRLAITYPEIPKMQTEAIAMAAIELKREKGMDIPLEIMVPLVSITNEITFLREVIENKLQEVFEREGVTLQYKIGTMIELPRACVIADNLAKSAEFFSFGTNDLTQMSFGFSRDDTADLIKEYEDKNIIELFDPFQSLDQYGVGQLIQMAVEKGKSVRPDIKLGICGEHGGDYDTIQFCNKIGLGYVSCSPFRVPIARLAAAQAAIKQA